MIGGRKIVALCTSRIYELQHNKFIKNFSTRLTRNGARLLIFAINTDFYWEENAEHPNAAVFDLIPFDKIDALLFMDERVKSHKVAKRVFAYAKKYDVPAVVIDGDYDGVISLRFDYEGGFEKIVRHVIEDHGCRRPHFIAGIKGNEFSEKRFERFRKVIAENGIEYDDSMLSYGEFWAAPARAAAEELLKREQLPDAIICANDIMAINVCDVLLSNGVEIPGQTIVTGFDGIPETVFSKPEIATVLCDTNAMAKTAADVILSLINGGVPETIVAYPELIPNTSCGCAANRSISVIDDMNNNFYRYQDDVRMLYEITVNMQMSPNYEKAADVLRVQAEHQTKPIIHNFCCIVDRACFDTERNYIETAQSDLLHCEKLVLFDSMLDIDHVMYLDKDKILPKLAEHLENEYPLIFNVLDYCGKPIGYVCYFFDSFDIVDYSRTFSITNTLSMGVGGHIIMMYQRTLSKKLQELYKYDTLTGLYNRAGFNSEFRMLKKRLYGREEDLTVIMADLDGLKTINDTFGHDAGDKAITLAAYALKNACPPGALCMRYGGDEFIAVIAGKCDCRRIMSCADKYIESASAEHDLGFDISISCGAYTTQYDLAFDLESAVKQADKQMYKVKYGKRTSRK